MKILIAASESVPFIKVGGLADVVGTLPRYLKERGHDVRVIVPKYGKIDGQKFGLKTLPYRLSIPLADNAEETTLKEGELPGGIPVYFVESSRFFFRSEVYGTSLGDYGDNRERFIFFSRAVLEAAKAIDFQPDVIHCHDWQTGIIPACLKTGHDGFFSRTASVYTIHNIAYQGIFGADTVKISGLPWSEFRWDRLEFFGHFNCMKAGLVYADMLSTVSPTYAREIQLPEQGRGMEDILSARKDDLVGILNGIDYTEWDPSRDGEIARRYSRTDLSGKQECKADLQRRCGFQADPSAFLVGAVSRLDPQKGYDLVVSIIPQLMKENVQLVILGRGERLLQEMLSTMALTYRGRMAVSSDFDNARAHQIYAGSDAFLMPSRFEPCGLGQMIAMAYGTVPIVRRTGGLADTVVPYNAKTRKGNGFVFDTAAPLPFKQAIDQAQEAFRNRKSWNSVQKNAILSDFSWKKSVSGYEQLYDRALRKARRWEVATRA